MPALLKLYNSMVFLSVWAQKAAKDSLNFHPRRVQSNRFNGHVGGPQFDLGAAPEDSFQSGARAIDQRHDNLAIASLVATFDQSDVAVADVFVDHRIALHPQSVNALRPNAPQHEARHANLFHVLNCVDRRTCRDATNQTHFANRICRDLIDAQAEFENSGAMLALDESTFFKRGDMLGDGRFRAHAEVPGDLCVRRLMSVVREKSSDVIEDFFLALGSRQHGNS